MMKMCPGSTGEIAMDWTWAPGGPMGYPIGCFLRRLGLARQAETSKPNEPGADDPFYQRSSLCDEGKHKGATHGLSIAMRVPHLHSPANSQGRYLISTPTLKNLYSW